jgi:hypothetical protein
VLPLCYDEVNEFIIEIYNCIIRMRTAFSTKNITEADINELFRYIMNSGRIMRVITDATTE